MRMINIWKNIKEWRKSISSHKTAEEKYPPQNDIQRAYRVEFGNIVDKFLISYYSERDEKHPNASHHLVYIAPDNNLYWIVDESDDEEQKPAAARNNTANAEPSQKTSILQNAQYKNAMSRLRNLLYAPLPNNLPESEVFHFRKMIGMGCKAALSQSWAEVDAAISAATKYRDERCKEYSRFLLLNAATIYMAILSVIYIAYLYLYPLYGMAPEAGVNEIPHILTLTGMMMGAVGAYVSIWTRYGKMDMTGLGLRRVHYLEAFSRMMIGIIFAMIVIFAVRGNIFFGNMPSDVCGIYVYSVLGFCAGFSEKWVPSLMEKFMQQAQPSSNPQQDTKEEKAPEKQNDEKSMN